MAISPHNILLIIELIFYAPALITSIYLCLSLSFHLRQGWTSLLLFCAVRIIATALDLSAIDRPDHNSSDITQVALFSFGLPLLLHTTIGLLYRLKVLLRKTKFVRIAGVHLVLLRLLLCISIALSGKGGVALGNEMVQGEVDKMDILLKVAILLWAVVLLAIVIIVVYFSNMAQDLQPRERHLLAGVRISLPLLVCRLLYIAIATMWWRREPSYRLIGGSTGLLACMAAVQDMLLVAIYLGVGLTLERVSNEDLVKQEGKFWDLWAGGRDEQEAGRRDEQEAGGRDEQEAGQRSSARIGTLDVVTNVSLVMSDPEKAG